MSLNWNQILSTDDPNICLDTFLLHFNYLLDEHAPLQKQTRKQKSLAHKPWINNEIKSQMKIRDRYFLKFCHAKDPETKAHKHSQYKVSRNDFTRRIRESKNEYYNDYFTSNKSNIKKTWEGIKQIVSFKSKNSSKYQLK